MDAPVYGPVHRLRRGYAEAVWVSRFENNVLTMGRGRIAFTALVTGPIAWQPIAEVRVLKDINNDYWNNLADAWDAMAAPRTRRSGPDDWRARGELLRSGEQGPPPIPWLRGASAPGCDLHRLLTLDRQNPLDL